MGWIVAVLAGESESVLDAGLLHDRVGHVAGLHVFGNSLASRAVRPNLMRSAALAEELIAVKPQLLNDEPIVAIHAALRAPSKLTIGSAGVDLPS